MKKYLIPLFAVLMLVFTSQSAFADINVDSSASAAAQVDTADDPQDIGDSDPNTFTEVLKKRFIEGGVGFMVGVLLCLIIGISIAIERLIYLSMATVNTKKLLSEVELALERGGVQEAKQLCQDTRGPVGSIFYDGLSRADEGVEEVEKAIIGGGSVQMGLMEKGTSWISLFIALAPMLGFLGTVLGMIEAFDAIVEQGGIKAITVASGIKKALITTVAGLIVAIILQIFYNFIISKIDGLVNNMEDASNVFVKMVGKHLSK